MPPNLHPATNYAPDLGRALFNAMAADVVRGSKAKSTKRFQSNCEVSPVAGSQIFVRRNGRLGLEKKGAYQ